MFKTNESELQRSPKKVKQYVKLLEKYLGNSFKVVGILEIGSFAKEEAVPSSDCDTRIFVESPNFYAWQLAGSRIFDKMSKQLEKQYKKMMKKEGFLPRKEYEWFSFNNPTAEKIKQQLEINVEFGITDSRFSKFCLENCDKLPTTEISLLFQSNILYDPQNYLKELRNKLFGKKPKATINFYKQKYLDSLPEEIYSHLKPHNCDLLKLEKSGQIQWVKWGVRCLRDAVATKHYSETGEFIYKKQEILGYYKKTLPKHYKKVLEIYSWKCNLKKRTALIKEFIKNQKTVFKKFKLETKAIEKIVKAVNCSP